jgi:hypothetical protein
LWFGRLTERAAGSSPRLHLGVTGRLPCTEAGRGRPGLPRAPRQGSLPVVVTSRLPCHCDAQHSVGGWPGCAATGEPGCGRAGGWVAGLCSYRVTWVWCRAVRAGGYGVAWVWQGWGWQLQGNLGVVATG